MSTQDDKTKYSSVSTEVLQNLFESMERSKSSSEEFVEVAEELNNRKKSDNKEKCKTDVTRTTNYKTLSTTQLSEIYQQNNRHIRTNSEFSQISKVLQDRSVSFELWSTDAEFLNKGETKGSFWAFDKLIAIDLIRLLYLLGALAIIGFSIYLIKEGLDFLWGGLLLVFGNIIWRVVCEALAIPFKIYERLCSIEKKQ